MIELIHPFSKLSEYLFAMAGIWIFYTSMMEMLKEHRLTKKSKVLDFKKTEYKNGTFKVK